MWVSQSGVGVWVAVAALVCGLAMASSGCNNKDSCSGCIQTPDCMWCGRSGNFTGAALNSLPRCIHPFDNNIISYGWRYACGQEDVYDPTIYSEIILNDELTQAGVLAGSGGIGVAGGAAGSSGERVVQIKPQRVGIKRIRVQESYNLQVTFRQAEDYPVEYAKITSKVELKDNATSPVIIKYYSKCKGTTERLTSECKGLRVGDQVEFRAEITVTECPKDPNEWNQVIGIYPVGLRESLIINLEMLCDCPCERPGDQGYQLASEECSFHGTYQCGVCDCDKGYLGSRCECGSSTPWGVSGSFDDSSCRQFNSSAICSGRGTCTCGECKCNERENPDERVQGPFCECTNFLCNRFNGQLCGGPDHGECVCNKCQCKPGWTGDDCTCEDSKDQCMNPETGEECSGQGQCECNQCRCYESDLGRYSGKYCEDCPTCKGKCVDYKPCVQCQVFQTGEFTAEECLANCIQFNSMPVDIVVEEDGERLCTFFDENDCRFKFVYGYDEDKEPVVRVRQTLECPPKLDILAELSGFTSLGGIASGQVESMLSSAATLLPGDAKIICTNNSIWLCVFCILRFFNVFND